MSISVNDSFDVVIVGAGQAGLAVAYYLRRSGLRYVILDAQAGPGGSWRHSWDSLALFSPAQWSSLPGWIMPGGSRDYPSRDALLAYITEYEKRYALPVERPVTVTSVRRDAGSLAVESDKGRWLARAVVSATGNWERPYIPLYPGRDSYKGLQIHSARYKSPAPFTGSRALIVGGGNSGAQIYAELSLVAHATWVTRREPVFMPDDVDGRYLFGLASERYLARQSGTGDSLRGTVTANLGDIVMVPPVKEARERGVLHTVRPFLRLTERGVVWADGREEAIDAVIWCTGFRPALDHLAPLGVIEAGGRILVEGTRSVREPRLWLVGYGDWTGYASATLIGVGRTARSTVEQIVAAGTAQL
jgi:cation diffusion facilitator CzcD-associated flavoprotein CzcO